MANLYELSTRYKEAEMLLNTAETDLDYEQAFNHLIETEAKLSEKIDNTAKYIRNTEGEIEKFKAEEKRLKDKRQALENKRDRLKDFVLDSLQHHGIESIQGEYFTVKIQENSQYSMKIEDEKLIPSEYFEDRPILDKQALKQDILENGIYVEGVQMTKGKHVRIR